MTAKATMPLGSGAAAGAGIVPLTEATPLPAKEMPTVPSVPPGASGETKVNVSDVLAANVPFPKKNSPAVGIEGPAWNVRGPLLVSDVKFVSEKLKISWFTLNVGVTTYEYVNEEPVGASEPTTVKVCACAAVARDAAKIEAMARDFVFIIRVFSMAAVL